MPCDDVGYNSLQGLCSGGSQPFAGVCCNSVNGSTFAVYEIDRYNVMNETGVFAACTQNSDCDIYGTGYFCNYFTPNGSRSADSPATKCSRPAANLVIQRCQWWSGHNDRDGSDHD